MCVNERGNERERETATKRMKESVFKKKRDKRCNHRGEREK